MSAFRRIVLSACLLATVSATSASAQGFDLRTLLTSFLRGGITLAPPAQGPSHEAHFIGADNAQFLALDQFNTLIGNQLSSFPVASSAGGFTYKFDPTLGVFTRSSDSFGPIYAERGETIGKGKFNFGLNYSHYTFDFLDSLDLREGSIGLVFQHMDLAPLGTNLYPFFEGDLITAQLSLKLETNITALVLTYGASDRLDLG
ncbi:MAG TPA: hypothetical protein VGR00_05570, partial [Thermoanaerobaculia bacterium]|nr:hypothetical protein [Thermoanaerobaculia bacterium]